MSTTKPEGQVTVFHLFFFLRREKVEIDVCVCAIRTKKKVSIPQTDLNDSVRSQGPSVVRLRAQQRANGPPCAGQVIAYVT